MDTGLAAPLRVVATDVALDLIGQLQAEHGPLLFHQSGGCCDGSAPMCYPQADYLTGDGDVRLGEIGGTPFYMSRSQFEYWKHCLLYTSPSPRDQRGSRMPSSA